MTIIEKIKSGRKAKRIRYVVSELKRAGRFDNLSMDKDGNVKVTFMWSYSGTCDKLVTKDPECIGHIIKKMRDDEKNNATWAEDRRQFA